MYLEEGKTYVCMLGYLDLVWYEGSLFTKEVQ